jgi:acyl-CoA synthetase (NDP forming)
MTVTTILTEARLSGRGSLNEADGKRLLAAFGVSVPPSAVVSGPDDVAAALGGLNAPFALKVMSQDILHKSDAGGVALRLADATAVANAIAAMAEKPPIKEARIDGYLIEEMAAPGTEIVVGAVRDPQFGPLLMVGLGGIFVEILKDVAFRICPVSEADARAMLEELRGAKILDGARGQEAVDKDAIVDILLRIGGENGLLMTHGDDILELDLNPVIATGSGAVAADARVILANPSAVTEDAEPKAFDDIPVVERFTPLFAPKAIAVLGASATSATLANTFIRRMKDFGYGGSLYPVHPKADEIEGLACYPSIAEAPEPIDYAYIAIAAKRIPDVLGGAQGRLRFAHVISSGFAEVSDGKDLEKDLIAKARVGGCRVIGPNSLGLYSPRGGVTFPVGAPKEVGGVGIVCQSGGLGTDIIKRGQWRGLRFSGLVTAGNSADLGPVDLVDFYFQDPQTKVIGLYLEDIKDGRRFFDLLRSEKATKPVVILRGGRSSQGRAAAASHTGALAGDGRAWQALGQQTGCALVDTLDEFLDALLAFQFLNPRMGKPTRRVALFGNGGGTSVLATDFFAEQGLDIAPFDGETRAALEAMDLPPGTSVANPIDAPVNTMQKEEGRVAAKILDIVYRQAAPDAVIMHLNLAAFVGRGGVDPIGNLIQSALQVQDEFPGQAHFMMALRVDGSPELDDSKRLYREKALAAGIPVYDELSNAALALKAMSRVEGKG